MNRDEIANALMMARGSQIVGQDMTPPPSDYRAADMIIAMAEPATQRARAAAWDLGHWNGWRDHRDKDKRPLMENPYRDGDAA